MKQTYFCPLDHFGSVSLTGQDAQTFLQGQITCDVNKVTPSQGQAGAYCTPKGNVIANFDLVAHADTLLLHMPLSIVPSVQQALAKYIVFSKAELHDSSATWCRFAIWGDAATECITEAIGSAPNSHLGSIQNESSLAWGMQSETSEFIAYCRPEDKAQVIGLLEQRASLAEVNAWETLQIDQGLMYVTPDISDSYVPQMLNLQATGAIDFKKGCYTGQEIVARMQYLGKLKRHLFIGQVHSSQAVMVGQQIDANKRKNVGRITSAAPNGEHTYRFTAVINRTEAQAEELHLHEQDKSIISLSPLPYEIDPQVFERIKL
ncbi:CAF17-like 4Fe-4S cluster assembly/insertion protein YgfZ [Candidatus Njordibacter sp. Uisw_058]|uniref:CAF17-like 4Fe-4S cluster assembly/insertion protein YgfZ n=1 Tax=Candidatus Njordibacter sp. Uisw_058 TaxID=3230974 RepID=UPI003D4F3378